MKYSALLGTPLDHSVSPAMFSALAVSAGIEYSHIKIRTDTVDDMQRNLEHLCQLGFVGCNITLPYKTAVLPLMDALDATAINVGAVNTVVFDNGKYIGFNTDAEGAIQAINTILNPIHAGSRVAIIGAGGAARAIVYELYKRGAQISLLNRTYSRAEDLVKEYGPVNIQAFHLTDADLTQCIRDAKFIINATSVGMFPDVNSSLVPEDILEKTQMSGKMCFDAVLNPSTTKFLRHAKSHGAVVCSGLYMMIYQAIAAFRIWTGINLQGIDINLLFENLSQHCEVGNSHSLQIELPISSRK